MPSLRHCRSLLRLQPLWTWQVFSGQSPWLSLSLSVTDCVWFFIHGVCLPGGRGFRFPPPKRKRKGASGGETRKQEARVSKKVLQNYLRFLSTHHALLHKSRTNRFFCFITTYDVIILKKITIKVLRLAILVFYSTINIKLDAIDQSTKIKLTIIKLSVHFDTMTSPFCTFF